MTKPALVADLFCGAGGTSTGARRALAARGIAMSLVAVNHWPLAIETHTRNHPDARHYCMDLESAKPEALVPEGKLDLLMASPTCTFHSRARGRRPTSDQQRMDPWHVVRWLTALRVKRLLVENVSEFQDWGPIDLRTGRPIKRRRGEYFRAWLAAIEGCGFRLEYRVLNCADFGDATTRERFFLMGRSDGRRLSWPDPTHSRIGGADLLGHGALRWRPAREIIDWGVEGKSILDRKRPLSPKTLARIYAGAVKFRWPEPFLVVLRNHMGGQTVDGPLPALCAGGNHVGLAEPIVFRMNQSVDRARNIRSAADPLCTITATGTDLGLAEPILVNMKGRSTADSIDIPAPAITAHARHLALAQPFVMGQHHERPSRSIEEPIPTVVAVARVGLVEPFIATVAHGDDPGARDPSSRRARSLDEPLQTIHAGGGKFGLVEPFVLSQASGGAPRSVEAPLPTIVGGGERGSGTALIAPYYGSGSGETCGSADAPLPTVTGKARFGLVVPVTQSNGGPLARSVDDPLPTMTTAKGGEFAVVMPGTHGDDVGRVRSVDDPLPTITGAHRGGLAFIAASFGERDGQEPRVHSLDDPVPTICAQGRVQVVEPASDGRRYDIRFRMLEPHELARAMGFSDDETTYEFAGNKTEVTKQIGNAVPVATATALIGALMS